MISSYELGKMFFQDVAGGPALAAAVWDSDGDEEAGDGGV